MTHLLKDTASTAASTATAPIVAYGYAYDHRLFVSQYNLKLKLRRNELNKEQLIFGKNYASGALSYMIRSLTGGNEIPAFSGPTAPTNNGGCTG